MSEGGIERSMGAAPDAERSLELRTERLRLMPLVAEDAGELHALWTTPGVRRYLWDDEVIPRRQTDEVVAESGRLMRRHGLGLWAVRGLGDEALIGFSGYWYFHQPPVLEFLFGVAESRWSEGVGREAGQIVLDYGFAVLGLDEVRASTDFANVASIRAVEKLGFTPLGRDTLGGLDTLFYRAVPPPAAG